MRGAAAIFAAALLALAGCRSSPYDYMENWAMREDAVRSFSVGADLIYLQGVLYTNVSAVAGITAYVRSEVGKGRFTGVARVFSPLVEREEDLAMALDWYFDNCGGGRPFFFVGEGAGGAMLKAYEESNSDYLKGKGLVASFYTEVSNEGFVKDWMVREVRDAVSRRRYRMQWGREMPDGMLKRSDGQDNGGN